MPSTLLVASRAGGERHRLQDPARALRLAIRNYDEPKLARLTEWLLNGAPPVLTPTSQGLPYRTYACRLPTCRTYRWHRAARPQAPTHGTYAASQWLLNGVPAASKARRLRLRPAGSPEALSLS